MPIQEALVWQKSQVPRPAGVLFDPPCKTRAQDLTSWNALVPAMKNEIGAGRYIMVLVQTRNTRSWVVNDMQYTYRPDEDYVVASFSLAATMGTSYAPGTIAHAWLNRVLDSQSGRTRGINAEVIQMFQCSAQGCNLSTVGLTRLINFHSKTGKTSSEAISLAQNAIVDGQKYGWRGSTFPGIWVAATPSAPALSGRARSGAFSGTPGPDPFAGF